MQQVFFEPRQFVAGQQVQREQTTQNALAQLAPAAIGGDQDALASLAQNATEAALRIQDKSDARRVRQEMLDLQRERLGISQRGLTAEEREQARTYAEAQTAEKQEATRAALKNMLMGRQSSNPQQYAAGTTALRRIDPSVENVPMESFDEFGPLFEGMSEVWADLPNSKPSATEAETARLMETGLDRNAAINIADGVWVTSQNAQTGEVQIIVKATGQPASQGSPDAFGKPFSKSKTAFGLGGAIRGTVNAAGDTLGLGQPFPETADTQRDFSVLRENLVDDLAGGYDRHPQSPERAISLETLADLGAVVGTADALRTDCR